MPVGIVYFLKWSISNIIKEAPLSPSHFRKEVSPISPPFPSPAKWPAQHPERLQLYSLPTPNGVKVAILLEETGLPYEAHRVSFDSNDQMSPEFVGTF